MTFSGGKMFYAHRFGFKPWGQRLFQKGYFKFLILDLLKDRPHYGYEIIRALEERFHGFYSPSPGIVYPTLQMFEEMGYVTSSQQDGKKIYTITDAGREFLVEREKTAEDVVSQIDKWWNPEVHGKLQKIMREMWETGRLIGYRAHELDADKLEQIMKVISQTHKDIESIVREKG
jgi:DNA-binding PadR family transcriptional regulator